MNILAVNNYNIGWPVFSRNYQQNITPRSGTCAAICGLFAKIPTMLTSYRANKTTQWKQNEAALCLDVWKVYPKNLNEQLIIDKTRKIIGLAITNKKPFVLKIT